MKKPISAGFTIIETMLFLAVTGLLIMGVLIGTGAALNNQRYRDAVETFKTVVQNQYAELGSVKNNRSDEWSCGSSAKPEDGDEYRGQSDCLIVGRYMLIDRSAITIFNVLAHKNTVILPQTSDIAGLRANYTYNVSETTEPRTMEWQTEAGWPTDGAGAQSPQTPSSLAIFFVRSPETGNIYTFTTNDVPSGVDAINHATFSEMMIESDATAATGRGERTICVVQPGAFAIGGDRSVYISPRAVGASAVEVRTNDMEGVAQC